MDMLIDGLRTINELLSAGIAITAFSLLLYALSFNLRDRVARSFAIILLCVVIVSVGDALVGVASSFTAFWLRVQWIGIIFLPPAYMHFSDALLATTGRPSRGRRRRGVLLTYLASFAFLALLPSPWLVGPLVENVAPAPHLQRTWLTWIFSFYYAVVIALAWINLWRAYQRTATSNSRRRMGYLLVGALAPALGSYPFLLFGSNLISSHALIFWVLATLSSLLVSVLLVLMAYAVAFFGVDWPDRVIKRRMFKWLMRGPVTASMVLALTTVVRQAGEALGLPYQTAIPIVMVGTLLVFEHLITLAAPVWERWLFHGGDSQNIQLIQDLEERLLTTSDLREYLESVLAAMCDRLQVSDAFVVVLGQSGAEMLLTVGTSSPFGEETDLPGLFQAVTKDGTAEVRRADHQLFTWKDYWLVPLSEDLEEDHPLLGFMGVARLPNQYPDDEQVEALMRLAQRASLALKDRILQQQVFVSLQALNPQVNFIQQLRAAARYEGTELLTAPEISIEHRNMAKWVKDALSHYWGGPKLSQSPLMRLQIVQHALDLHEGNPTNALRSILNEAIDKTRPEGDRRFTGEWILYNILEMKFLEGRKVREIAMRLAMSEADLYRKQRVAIEAVAQAIIEMERQAREEKSHYLSEHEIAEVNAVGGHS
jgi:MFS family permease